MRRILGLVLMVMLAASACTDQSQYASEPEGNLAFVDEETIEPADTTVTTQPEADDQPSTEMPEVAAEDVEVDVASEAVSGEDGEEPLEADATDGPRAELSVEMNVVTSDGSGDGLVVATGDVVTWSYQVTNTGDVDLTEVDVIDDSQGLICTVNVAQGQTADCEATTEAASGEFTTSAAATVTLDGITVSASDHSGYVGLDDERQGLEMTLDQISATGADSFVGVAVMTNTSDGSDPVYLSDFLVSVASGASLTNVACTVETMPAGELPEFIVFDDEISLNFECVTSQDLDGEYTVTVNAGIGGSEEIVRAEALLNP